MVLNPRDGYSLEFVMGLLNQRVIEFYLRKRGSPFRGGYYSRGTAVLSDVPVPSLNLAGNATHLAAHAAIVKDVKEIMNLKTLLAGATGRTVNQLQRRLLSSVGSLEQRFDALWGFTGQANRIRLPGN
jgi:hypothetical protein